MRTIRLYWHLIRYGVIVGYWEARHDHSGNPDDLIRANAYRALMDEVGDLIVKG